MITTKERLEKYVIAQADRKYSPRANNCLTFVMGFYGMADRVRCEWRKIEKDEDLIAFVSGRMADSGFALTAKPSVANIVAFNNSEGRTAFALRWDDEFVVGRAESGVFWQRPDDIIKEFEEVV